MDHVPEPNPTMDSATSQKENAEPSLLLTSSSLTEDISEIGNDSGDVSAIPAQSSLSDIESRPAAVASETAAIGLRSSMAIESDRDCSDGVIIEDALDEATSSPESTTTTTGTAAASAQPTSGPAHQQDEVKRFADVHVDPFAERAKRDAERVAKATAQGQPPPPPEHILYPLEQDLLSTVYTRDETTAQTVVHFVLASVLNMLKQFPKAVKFFSVKRPPPERVIATEVGFFQSNVSSMEGVDKRDPIYKSLMASIKRDAEAFGLPEAADLYRKKLPGKVYTTARLRELFSRKRCAKFGIPERIHHLVNVIAKFVDQRSRITFDMERPFTKATEVFREHIRMVSQTHSRELLAKRDLGELDEKTRKREEDAANALTTHALAVIDFTQTQLVLNMARRTSWMTWEFTPEEAKKLSEAMAKQQVQYGLVPIPLSHPREEIWKAFNGMASLEKLGAKFIGNPQAPTSPLVPINGSGTHASTNPENGKLRLTLTFPELAQALLVCPSPTRLVLPPISDLADTYAFYLHTMQHLVAMSDKYFPMEGGTPDKAEQKPTPAPGLTPPPKPSDLSQGELADKFAVIFNHLNHAMQLIMLTLAPVSFVFYTRLMHVRKGLVGSLGEAHKSVTEFDERFKEQCFFYSSLREGRDYGRYPQHPVKLTLDQWFSCLVTSNVWLQMAPGVGEFESLVNMNHPKWDPRNSFERIVKMRNEHFELLRRINGGKQYYGGTHGINYAGDSVAEEEQSFWGNEKLLSAKVKEAVKVEKQETKERKTKAKLVFEKKVAAAIAKQEQLLAQDEKERQEREQGGVAADKAPSRKNEEEKSKGVDVVEEEEEAENDVDLFAFLDDEEDPQRPSSDDEGEGASDSETTADETVIVLDTDGSVISTAKTRTRKVASAAKAQYGDEDEEDADADTTSSVRTETIKKMVAELTPDFRSLSPTLNNPH